jgi:hypothetical protein
LVVEKVLRAKSGKVKVGSFDHGFLLLFQNPFMANVDSISFLEAVFGCCEILGKKGRNIKLGPLIVGF